MANMINELPLVLIDDIVSRVDAMSIPHFKATCKLVSNQITDECYDSIVVKHIKEKLENIVNVVKKYHVALTNNDIEEQLFKKLIFQLHDHKYEEKASMAIKWMMISAYKDTNFPIIRLKTTFMRYINNLPLIENDDVILNAFKRFVVGTDKSTYIVSFNYINNSSKEKSHYCVINLQFHDNGDVKMHFSIEDVDKNISRVYSKKSRCPLKRCVRFIEIIVNDTTLNELAECIVAELGRETCQSKIQVVSNIDKWVGNFTKYKETFYDNAINSFVNPTTYRDEIINILF
jgi:hypothetical protein